MKLWEYFLCAKKTNIIIIQQFCLFPASLRCALVRVPWCRSQHSDVEHPSLFVHCLYILLQIRLGKKLQAILSAETFRHVYKDCFMYRVHLPLLVNKAQCIQVLRSNCVAVYAVRKFIKKILICVPKITKILQGFERHKGELYVTEFPCLDYLIAGRKHTVGPFRKVRNTYQ